MSRAVAMPARSISHHAEPRAGSILIIDDESEIRESLQTLLELEGYSIAVAGSGQEGLALFDDHSFDVVLQLDTLQHLRNTEKMLRETARVGRIGVVSFPNFAHWPNRFAVLRGRMPVTKTLPYQWYDTPNIRVGTYADFEVLARKGFVVGASGG